MHATFSYLYPWDISYNIDIKCRAHLGRDGRMGEVLQFDKEKKRTNISDHICRCNNACLNCIYKTVLLQLLPSINNLIESLPGTNQYSEQRKTDKIIRELLIVIQSIGDVLHYCKDKVQIKFSETSYDGSCHVCSYKNALWRVLPLVNKLHNALPIPNQYVSKRANDNIIRKLLSLAEPLPE